MVDMFVPHLHLSWYSICGLHVAQCVMSLVILDFTEGISWLAEPHEHTYVKQGSPFSLHWHYRMNENETFLSSEIEKNVKQIPIAAMAARHKGEDVYYKYRKEDIFFSIFGKNNVTFTVHRAEIGQNITYCCEVVSRSVVGKRKNSSCCKVFVYDVPRITYHIPQMNCKQGDSIKLQCNATGIPKPHVGWIHDDTHELIASSTDIILNITGKRSEGRYCCDANNEFGRQTACTAVNVREYEPDNTTLLVKQTNRDDDNIINIECKADASPPSNHFIITFNDTQYNSSDGLKTIEVRAPSKDKRHEIAVSCIPCNKYGKGPIKKVILPLYAPPRFITSIRTQYNMTVGGITLKCDATGNPPPNITWTSGYTGDIVGTGKYYQVPYVKCAATTMTFYCHARNAMGNISSPEIPVKLMTARNCSTADKGLEKKNQMFSKKVIIMVSVIVAVFVINGAVVFTLTSWWRRNTKVRKDAETAFPSNEDAYQDPIDAVMPYSQGSQSLARSNTVSTDGGYATVEECGFWPKRKVHIPMITVQNNPHHEEEESQYESLVQSTVPSEI